MRIYLATDHAGFEHKNVLKAWLLAQGEYEVIDCGAQSFDPDDDYPDYIGEAARAISADPTGSKGVIFGGSGQGEAMLTNQFPYVRATVYYGNQPEILTLSREHNDANVLSLGARFVDINAVVDIVEQWLAAPGATEERHIRRLKKSALLRP